jgi:hypothetical protein
MEPTFREDLSPETEDKLLLEALTRQLLLKNLRDGKDL